MLHIIYYCTILYYKQINTNYIYILDIITKVLPLTKYSLLQSTPVTKYSLLQSTPCCKVFSVTKHSLLQSTPCYKVLVRLQQSCSVILASQLQADSQTNASICLENFIFKWLFAVKSWAQVNTLSNVNFKLENLNLWKLEHSYASPVANYNNSVYEYCFMHSLCGFEDY